MSTHVTTRTRDIAREYYPWMNEAQIECLQFVSDIHDGLNHFFGKIRPSYDNGIVIHTDTLALSTFDYSTLTKAVIIAHDRAIRFEVLRGTNNKRFTLAFHKRQREGDSITSHPTIEEQITRFRANGSQP